jgi:hypothetical protein
LDVNPDALCDIPLLYLLSKLRPVSVERALIDIEKNGK